MIVLIKKNGMTIDKGVFTGGFYGENVAKEKQKIYFADFASGTIVDGEREVTHNTANGISFELIQDTANGDHVAYSSETQKDETIQFVGSNKKVLDQAVWLDLSGEKQSRYIGIAGEPGNEMKTRKIRAAVRGSNDDKER